MRLNRVAEVVVSLAALAALLPACEAIGGVDFDGARLKDGAIQSPTNPQAATLACDKACADYGFQCGKQFDPCGKELDCGTCADGSACNAGKCACAPKACADLGMQCGVQNNGCGGITDCGACVNPSEGCADGKCKCVPKTCADQNAECGSVPDGCGGTYACGSCTDPTRPGYDAAKTNCGGEGPGRCGVEPCVPRSCLDQGKNCGDINDGCGNILNCGACTSPQTCGGSGVANVCGCTGTSCAAQGKNCGLIPDGCGGNLDCGACGGVQTCGATGVANVCGCVSNGTCSECCGEGVDNCGNPCTRTRCCGGGGGCFGAGTPVRMADGSMKPIELVEPGEFVASWDARTGTMVAARVVARLVHGPETSADGFIVRRTPFGTLRVTPNHPVVIDGVRRPAEFLREGSRIYAPRLRTTLASFEPHVLDLAVRSELVGALERVGGNGEPTIDLKVEGPGTFFAANLLVEQKQIQ